MLQCPFALAAIDRKVFFYFEGVNHLPHPLGFTRLPYDFRFMNVLSRLLVVVMVCVQAFEEHHAPDAAAELMCAWAADSSKLLRPLSLVMVQGIDAAAFVDVEGWLLAVRRWLELDDTLQVAGVVLLTLLAIGLYKLGRPRLSFYCFTFCYFCAMGIFVVVIIA